jgi:hypothetical protein
VVDDTTEMLAKTVAVTALILSILYVSETQCKSDGQSVEGERKIGDGTISEDAKSRDGKLFSLFAVVTFPNNQCQTVSDTSMFGTCLSSTECLTSGGTSDGNCAAGFGVCCMFQVIACGGAFIQNCTYIANPSFPSVFTTENTPCEYIAAPSSTEICQLRLDFDTFELGAPSTMGECTDMLTVTSPTGRNPPVICGTNNGLHMYVETGRSATPTTINVATGAGTTISRRWKIKVSQIECSSTSAAPTDCTQYFTGTSGTFTSYNFPDRMLENQQFSTCVRPASGFCSISYSESAQTTPDPFTLGIVAAAPLSETTLCTIAFIEIALSQGTSSGQFCGGFLNPVNGQGNSGTVVQLARPFLVNTRSAGDQVSATGYSIDFAQQPCA